MRGAAEGLSNGPVHENNSLQLPTLHTPHTHLSILAPQVKLEERVRQHTCLVSYSLTLLKSNLHLSPLKGFKGCC